MGIHMSKNKKGKIVLQEFEGSYPPECYKNRELSWLEFNERVLEEANDTLNNPLCERLNFLSIFQSNLDEYYMVRVGLLHDRRKLSLRDTKTLMTPKEQLDAVLAETGRQIKQRDKTYKSLLKQLKLQGIEILKFDSLTDKEKRAAEKYFLASVLPFLSPQIVSSRQPFPFLNNKEIYAVSLLKMKGEGECLGIIPCSIPVLKRLVSLGSDTGRYILVDELILRFAQKVFDPYQVLSSSLVSIVRNADITIDEIRANEDEKQDDYRKSMEKMIQRRKKLSPIKLEFTGMNDNDVVNLLCRTMKLPRRHAFYSASPLNYGFIKEITEKLADKKELFYTPHPALKPSALPDDKRVMDIVLKRDVLISFPYESMRSFLRFLFEAAEDPEVSSIKITLYRTAQSSRIVDALVQAAENGKEVLVLMELRARFDEENNVLHSKDLENAGCRVIYGLEHYKVHSKLCVITRKHGDEIQYLTHVGTGNYNEITARIYTDYSLLTCNRQIGEDGAAFFNSLALGESLHESAALLVAPDNLKSRVLEMIEAQTQLAKHGRPAYIGFKINSLTDRDIIDALIEASMAGVKVQLLVRGICCLVTGVEGYTDNIEVYSIVGRYLEHSRIYIFGPAGSEQVFISSADMMTRNTVHRVEVAAPIYDSTVRKNLLDDFRALLRDNVKLRMMQEDGRYHYVSGEGQEPFCAQEFFAAGGNRSNLPEEAEASPVDEPAPVEEARAEITQNRFMDYVKKIFKGQIDS